MTLRCRIRVHNSELLSSAASLLWQSLEERVHMSYGLNLGWGEPNLGWGGPMENYIGFWGGPIKRNITNFSPGLTWCRRRAFMLWPFAKTEKGTDLCFFRLIRDFVTFAFATSHDLGVCSLTWRAGWFRA